MSSIPFYKCSGCGNDFIIIDNREQMVDQTDLSAFVAKVCRRKFSVGADGLILVEDVETADFKWHFFNSDGSRADMCGNGARCVARFAYINGIAGPELSFETDVGMISAQVINDRVKIKMTDPTDFRREYPLKVKSGTLSVSSINTGVPHLVIEKDDIEHADVVGLGREIRFLQEFAPAGTNVNFVCRQKDGSFANRTYERGVEDETLACGTGCVASALVISCKHEAPSPINILTGSGGYLTVHYKKEGQDKFSHIYLEGDARIIYKGKLWEESWQ